MWYPNVATKLILQQKIKQRCGEKCWWGYIFLYMCVCRCVGMLSRMCVHSCTRVFICARVCVLVKSTNIPRVTLGVHDITTLIGTRHGGIYIDVNTKYKAMCAHFGVWNSFDNADDKYGVFGWYTVRKCMQSIVLSQVPLTNIALCLSCNWHLVNSSWSETVLRPRPWVYNDYWLIFVMYIGVTIQRNAVVSPHRHLLHQTEIS